ncbi:MAG: hypothetical protein ACWGOD_10100, partial [Desulfobulbales bacterium]
RPAQVQVRQGPLQKADAGVVLHNRKRVMDEFSCVISDDRKAHPNLSSRTAHQAGGIFARFLVASSSK